MLTSIKDALNNERYYDAVSNNINSTITMYSNIDELQQESKVFIEDAYKPLRYNVNVMTETATESFNLIEKLSEKILPSFNKIGNMRSSFLTEEAYSGFLELAYDDALNYIKLATTDTIKLYRYVIDMCSKLKKFISNTYSKFNLSSNLVKFLIKSAKSMNISDTPISEFFTKGDPDVTVDFIQVDDVDKITTDKFSEYLSFIQMYICKNDNKEYMNRLKEKCNVLVNISTELSKFCKGSISGINNYERDEGKNIKKTIETFLKTNTKHVDTFFKFMDPEDINLWIKHKYLFTPSYDSDSGSNEFKISLANKIKEVSLFDSIIYSQNKLEIEMYEDSEDANIVSLSSPLNDNDICRKLKGISLSEKKPFNAKDLFGYLTVSEVLEKLSDTISKFEIFKTNIKSDIIDIIQNRLNESSKINIETLKTYRDAVDNELNFITDTNNNLNRSLCICLMKLISDMNTSIIAMNQLITNDIVKKCVCVVKANAAVNILLTHIKTTLDKESN